MNSTKKDSKYIKRCLELAKESVQLGDLPFGALILHNDEILAESTNTGLKDITGHAEVNAIKKALLLAPRNTIHQWTLYSNIEPCAMCSFLVRDLGIGRVVFGSSSPFWGGKSKWNILTDTDLKPEFTSNKNANPPEVTMGILKEEVDSTFDKLNWEMHKEKDI